MGDSDLFSLFIHHGGHFGIHEGRDVYMKGFFVTVYDLKRSLFDLDKLHRLVKAIGYASWDKLWYRLPAPKRKRGRPAKEKNATEDETSRSGAARGGAVRGRAASLHGRGIYVSRGRCGRRSVTRGEATGRGGARGGSVAAQIAIEKNMAKGGGVFVGESGNIFYSAPGSSVVQHVHRGRENNDGASTQESRIASQHGPST